MQWTYCSLRTHVLLDLDKKRTIKHETPTNEAADMCLICYEPAESLEIQKFEHNPTVFHEIIIRTKTNIWTRTLANRLHK